MVGTQDGIWRQARVEIAARRIGGEPAVVPNTDAADGQKAFLADRGHVLTELAFDGVEVRLVVVERFANAGDFCRGRKDSARGEQHRQEDENGDQQFNKGEGSLHGQSSRTVTYTGSMRRPERSVTGTNQMRSTVWYQ